MDNAAPAVPLQVFRADPVDNTIISSPYDKKCATRSEMIASIIPYTSSIVTPEAYAELCRRTRVSDANDVIPMTCDPMDVELDR